MTHQDAVAQAQIELKKDKEPTTCPRCGGKPGEPGCGKLIHVIMDGYYERVMSVANRQERE